MGMSNYVLDEMEKIADKAREAAMEYAVSGGDGIPRCKDDCVSFVEDHWPDFVDDNNKHLFGE